MVAFVISLSRRRLTTVIEPHSVLNMLAGTQMQTVTGLIVGSVIDGRGTQAKVLMRYELKVAWMTHLIIFKHRCILLRPETREFLAWQRDVPCY